MLFSAMQQYVPRSPVPGSSLLDILRCPIFLVPPRRCNSPPDRSLMPSVECGIFERTHHRARPRQNDEQKLRRGTGRTERNRFPPQLQIMTQEDDDSPLGSPCEWLQPLTFIFFQVLSAAPKSNSKGRRPCPVHQEWERKLTPLLLSRLRHTLSKRRYPRLQLSRRSQLRRANVSTSRASLDRLAQPLSTVPRRISQYFASRTLSLKKGTPLPHTSSDACAPRWDAGIRIRLSIRTSWSYHVRSRPSPNTGPTLARTRFGLACLCARASAK